MGSKNNPAARGTAGGIKKINGKVVKPVKYIGKYIGNDRKYILMDKLNNKNIGSNDT